MAIFQSAIAIKIILITGLINLALLIILFFSCRCLPMITGFGKLLMKNQGFQRFYKYHCYVWLVLWISVIIHFIFVIAVIGFPF